MRLANLSALRCSVEVLLELLLDRALPRLSMVLLLVAGEGILERQGDKDVGGADRLLLEPKMATAAYMLLETV